MGEVVEGEGDGVVVSVDVVGVGVVALLLGSLVVGSLVLGDWVLRLVLALAPVPQLPSSPPTLPVSVAVGKFSFGVSAMACVMYVVNRWIG